MPIAETNTQVVNQRLNLPALPDKLRDDQAFARWWYDARRVLQERDADFERRIKALEEA